MSQKFVNLSGWPTINIPSIQTTIGISDYCIFKKAEEDSYLIGLIKEFATKEISAKDEIL